MRSGILRNQVQCLRLRVDAPFPSQLVGRSRRYLRVVVVKSLPRAHPTFLSILRLRLGGRLPLHVRRGIRATVA